MKIETTNGRLISPNGRTVGLRDAAPEDIPNLIKKYESRGFKVEHITAGLKFNGVLRCHRG